MPTSNKGARIEAQFVPAQPPEGSVVDPVIDLDEETPESLLSSQEFQNDEQDTTRHQRSGEAIPQSFTDALGLDRRFMTPERQIKGSAEVADVGGDGFDPIEAIVRKQVNDLVAQELARLGGNGALLQSLGTIPFQGGQVASEPQPSKFAKHYRNDIAPNLVIQELDMSVLEAGGRPQSHPIPGSYIRYRNGHLFLGSVDDPTVDANKIAQMEYMRERSMYSPDGQTTLGGNPSIYEDDGGDIFRCYQGCDFITASKNSYRAHMKSTHQIDIAP